MSESTEDKAAAGFIEKWVDSETAGIYFGAGYIVVLEKETYKELDRIDYENASAVAMILLGGYAEESVSQK